MDGPTAVFAAGNVLTGKGNIKDSLDSGTEIGTRVAEAYLGLSNEELKIAEGARKEAAASGEKIAGAMTARQKIAPDGVASLLAARAQTPARSRLRGQLPRMDRQGHAPGPTLKGRAKILGAGVTPAQGSVKPTVGFTFNEDVLFSLTLNAPDVLFIEYAAQRHLRRLSAQQTDAPHENCF